VWSHGELTGITKVNWDGVAKATGLKNGATASARFGQIKKKIGWVNPTPGSSPPVSPSKVTKNRGRVGGKAIKKGRGKKLFEEDDFDIDAKQEPDNDEDDIEIGVKQETAHDDDDEPAEAANDEANVVAAKDEPGDMEAEQGGKKEPYGA
jgi:hypothetical protein